MRKAIELLNDLVQKGLIRDYAIGGSIGTMFYTETISTFDLDVFVLPNETGIILNLGKVYDYCKAQGYSMEGQHIVVDGVPVDMLPPSTSLVEEAIKFALTQTFSGVPIKVFAPEYLIAIALQVGRSNDLRKIELLREQGEIDENRLSSILKNHGLYEKWIAYVSK